MVIPKPSSLSYYMLISSEEKSLMNDDEKMTILTLHNSKGEIMLKIHFFKIREKIFEFC